ncbi:MAG: SIS domain-containing protein, partial [Thermoplasmata archaeon]|nr:SIS domain-containing protein [Thermoplasmata archaeon]
MKALPTRMVDLPPATDPRPPTGRTRHPYFTHEMIRRQEVAARATIAASSLSAPIIPVPPKGGGLLFTGIGSSFHAAMATAFAAGPTLGYRFPARAVPSFDLVDLPELSTGASVALLFTSSGSTALTLSALRMLKEKGIITIVVTGSQHSAAAQLADHILPTRYSEENSWMHTVSYTSALCAGLTLLRAWAVAPDSPKDIDDQVAEGVVSGLALESRALDLVDAVSDRQRVFILGSGAAEATAREGALKIRLATGRLAVALGVEEFLHGDLPAVGEHALVIGLSTTPFERARARHGLAAAAATGARCLLIDTSGGETGEGIWSLLS